MIGVVRRRVAVTGLGIVSPAGCDVDDAWARVLAAEPAAAPIQRFDPSALPVRFACEVGDDFAPDKYLGFKEVRRTDRVAQMGTTAALDAFHAAGDLAVDPARAAVVVGTGIGGLATQEAEEKVLFEQGPSRVSPLLVPMMMPNATAAQVALQLGWTGPTLCIATACAAGTHAVGEGARLVRDGSADVVLAGGAEAVITPVAMAAFARMGALSTRNDDPASASRPFDATRDGFVMGEGAAFLVLEEWDRAIARGARVLGEVLGYGATTDAHHITAPAPGGAGAAACVEVALADAGVAASAIGHVNAHGTSTPLNDEAEAAALGKVFGPGAVPVTASKGVLGHLIGAAGAAEAVLTVRALGDGVVPPVANHRSLGAGIDLDVVAGVPRSIAPAPAVSASFGFGGHNAAVVLGPPPA